MPKTMTKGFIRVPKALLLDDVYSGLPPAAILLYGLLLDRLSLSIKIGDKWKESDGSVFVYCTLCNVQNTFHIGHDLATKLFRDLEHAKLITRETQGRGKPAKIFVHPFPEDITFVNVNMSQRSMRQNQVIDCVKSAPNNTYTNYTESNYNDEAAYMQNWLTYDLPVDGART